MVNENIATVLAAIIALGLALQAGVGPVVMFLTEAVKDALEPPDGFGGLISVIMGVTLGVLIGGLTAATTVDSGLGTYTAFGAVAGLFMAAGAIKSYKASGSLNVAASAGIHMQRQYEAAESEPVKFDPAIHFETGYQAGLAASPKPSVFANMSEATLDPDWFSKMHTAEDFASPVEEVHGYKDSDWSNLIVPDGEPDSADDYDFTAARHVGGHTGEAKSVDPLPDLPDPTHDYRGNGHPQETTTIYEAP